MQYRVYAILKNGLPLLFYVIFWLLFFQINRVIFILYFQERFHEHTFFEILQIFVYSLRMDVSMAGYFSAIPLVGYLLSWFVPQLSINKRFLTVYTSMLIILVAFITVIDFNIYREWGTKINYRVFEYLFSSFKEALVSSYSSPIVFSVFIFLLLVSLGSYLFRKLMLVQLSNPVYIITLYLKLPVAILLIGICFLMIRGNVGVAPMNASMVYFSDKPLLNRTALNTEWNLIQSVLENVDNTRNPYLFFAHDKERRYWIQEVINNNRIEKSQQVSTILRVAKPNIVLIVVESFTADLIKCMGGDKEAAPHFEEWRKEGLLFSNIYAAGDRTDKGLIAIISGFPSLANRRIITENNKQERLPALSSCLKKNGYHTSFYYGGELEFSNFKSYLLSHAYERLVGKNSFAIKDMNSKWGAHDEVVLKKHLRDMRQEPQPFFSTILTLSNHEPFEIPNGKLRFGNQDNLTKFMGTAYYTDSCLNEYIQQAKKQSWYSNTLFVIVADHGHNFPKNYQTNYAVGRYRIPLLLFGGALKKEYQGQTMGKIGMQTDIPHTLLAQLGMVSTDFFWSRNLLTPTTKDFAFYAFNDGFGVVTPKQVLIFDAQNRRLIEQYSTETPMSNTLTKEHETCEARMKTIENKMPNNVVMGSSSPLKNKLTDEMPMSGCTPTKMNTFGHSIRPLKNKFYSNEKSPLVESEKYLKVGKSYFQTSFQQYLDY